VFEPLQRTLSSPATFAGVGVHSGQRVRATVRPAPADHGIVFVRTDLSGDNRVAVEPRAALQTPLNTKLANAAGVDNALVELDGPEAPIMDGSAEPFVKMIDRAGRRTQDAPRRYIEILRPIEVIRGDKRAALSPAMGFEVAFEIDFPGSRAIGRQSIDLRVDETAFRNELAPARTFGFTHEVEALRAQGLALGGGLDNAVVIDGDTILNPEGLRFTPDEFVRHKALDAIGDLYVLGAPVIGRFEGRYAGHAINNALVRALLEAPDAWRFQTFASLLAEAV
jgi:UDP-3-O-[3-hydroxymyristoyl] N-acetylglucosamine deacetylase